MRKFLTLFAALFASLSIWAGVTVFTEASQVTTDGSYTIYGSNSSGSNQANVIFPDPAAEIGFPAGTQSEGTYYSKISGTSDLGAKLAENKRVAVKGLAKGDQITVYWFATNTTNTTLTLSYATASNKGAKLYDGETQNPVVSKTIYVSQLPALTDDDIDKIVNGYAESEGLAYISSNNAIYVYAVKIAASCEAPAEALALDADKKTDIIVGDEITFSTSGGNGGDVTIAGKDGETITDNKWTATKGEHTFIATQEVKDGVCGNSVELKLTVVSNDPVTAATISGKTSAVIGEEVELTCVAAEATAFQWYKNNAKIDGATEATYTFTSDAKGSFVFFCEASNKNNTEPIKSNELTINVTEVCGELIKATTQQEVTGVVGGTVDTNLSKGDAKKLDKKKYFGISLAAGTFAEGDVFVMNITSAAGATMGTMKLYADKDGTEKLFESSEIGEEGENSWELPAEVAGKSALYVRRGDGNDWNPTFSYVAVNRPCDDGEAKLNVSPASIELAATAKNNGKAEAKVKFTGRHLAAGTYNLALTEVAGLSVNPTSVTVDADGKLAAEVTVAFESAVDVLGANGELSLTVGELTKKVDIAYSANLKKTYAKSIDIEQLVMDNGVNFDIQGELTKRGYDFGSLSGLDSLNDAKDFNNEPFLGLKIKTAGGFIGCWIKQDATVEVKFGNVAADVKFIANGAELTKTPAELADPFTYKAEGGDAYIELRTTTGGTVVVKHITFEGGAPLSNDVTLNWLKIEDKAVTADENKVYAYQVPVDFKESDLTVTFELHDANAMADKKSPFLASVPEFGATAPIDTKLTVTAEDGETKAEYIIRVSRVAPSTEASIQELKIDGKVIAENDGKFEYEVAFDSKQTEVEVAFILADKATADRDNPFKVAVPDNPDMGATQAVIKVTAEDKVTTKEYKVIVTRAEEPQQGIDSVQASEINSQKVIRNGQLFILKNGVLYNAQGAIMR
ncbi:MAG: hypothetical protein IKX20_02360 [Paludibacteraceae bacterium]|nr:hypothetical protein [Paludibacteraceae bacterium]